MITVKLLCICNLKIFIYSKSLIYQNDIISFRSFSLSYKINSIKVFKQFQSIHFKTRICSLLITDVLEIRYYLLNIIFCHCSLFLASTFVSIQFRAFSLHSFSLHSSTFQCVSFQTVRLLFFSSPVRSFPQAYLFNTYLPLTIPCQ